MRTNDPPRDPEDVANRLAAVRGVLRAHDIDLQLRGDAAILSVDGTRLERPWSLTEPRGPYDDARHGGWLLLAENMPPARAAIARERGDWYVDLRGRIFIRAPGVLVDVHDRPATPVRKTGEHFLAPHLLDDESSSSSSSSSSGGAAVRYSMTPRRAQVVCLLLDQPRLASASLRTIAERSGVSVGIAQQVMSALEEGRFLLHGRGGLNRVGELLDQWTAAFGTGLGARLELGRFGGDLGLDAWLRTGQSVYRSGEAVSPELQGGDLTVYVEHLDMGAILASRWDPLAERPNIVVRQQFWSEPHRRPGVYEALLPLRLADLLMTEDPRHRSAAGPLRKEILERHAH